MDGKQFEEQQATRIEKENGKEINIRAIYSLLRKRIWVILIITSLFTGLGVLYNSKPVTPAYAASSRVIIAASQDLMGTLKVMFREPIVLTKVIDELGLDRSVNELRNQIRADSVDGSLVTVVSVVDFDPRMAADIANKSIEVYKQVAADTLGVSNIRVLTKAEENSYNINVKSNRIVFVAFFIGFIMSIGLILLLDALDDSIKSEREVEELLGLTMLGHVSKMKRKDYAKRSKKQKNIAVRGETIGS
ncbi:capsular polysaccharide biosynthesis protein [Paenibacillus castaneae]|uniref:YveK family protein n=1 Tax=Paenibacillus castaneae TaxID=474957 RepID=UPI00141BA8CD|nr:Wzz/FepE/Etk N-terminal domain-containing protein [Paenibacillus castaneae]NIK76110.1 capsular polysaccharide biosynthesis protein [Paenibacillus castaneae]